jgi:hypothetical protein
MNATKREDDLVDAGSEYSFPASDPPSYMGSIALVGSPPRGELAREAVIRAPTDPDEVKSAEDAPQGTGPARKQLQGPDRLTAGNGG